MPHAAVGNKRFAGKPALWHGAGMKTHACLVLCCLTLLACHPATTAANGDPIIDDDASTDDASDDGGDAASTCTAIGCKCTSNSDCASKLCSSKGGCVACILSNGGVEKCDGLDNNCNGQTDEATCPGDGHCMLGACDGSTNKCHMVPAQDAISCSDGNACTLADKCAAGTCVGDANSCSDGNVCTSEDCAPATGCVFLPLAVTCDDGSACTLGDACSGTVCTGTAKDCSDANPCTIDTCTAGTCLSTASTGTCDDGDGCTTGDVCTNLVCAGVVSCQDGDPCTLDACDPVGNTCTHTGKVGWQTPLCTGCAPGFSGANCDTCTDTTKVWPDC